MNEDTAYNHREAVKSYFPNGYTMSLAMRRARRRYFWPNVRGCIVLTIFGSAIYFYSLEAVAQDDFDDLASLIPDVSERAAIPSLEELDAARAEKVRRRKQGALLTEPDSDATLNPSSSSFGRASAGGAVSRAIEGAGRQEWGTFGWGPKLSYYWPRDSGGGLVVGAPKLEELGRMGDLVGEVAAQGRRI